MDMTAILALLLLAAFFTVLLRQYRPEFAIGAACATGAVVFVQILRALLPTLAGLRTLLDGAAVSAGYTGILFKALGICLLTQFTADACRDAGEGALATKAEFVGKVLLLTLSLPLFEEIITLATSLLQG